jgi:branched-subunit amino acid aminotransferase/4-amino-4-deoxychorismate lyase
MHVYLNGQMIDEKKAAVSVFDAGFQHAVGLFETMGAYHGRVFRLKAHLSRLQRSARELGLSRGLDVGLLGDAVVETIRHNRIARARVRLTVTAGNTSVPRPGLQDESLSGMTTLVVPTEPTVYAPAYFEDGITVLVTPSLANAFDPTAGHKTLAYWSRLRALRQAASAGAGEAVWLDTNNTVSGGSISNIFVVKDGVLLTPIARGEEASGGFPAPALPGVTRAAIFELADSHRIEVSRQVISIDDLLDAEEVFLTNSSWLVLPVTKVERKAIGNGRVGAMTRKLRVALLELIEEETTAGDTRAEE